MVIFDEKGLVVAQFNFGNEELASKVCDILNGDLNVLNMPVVIGCSLNFSETNTAITAMQIALDKTHNSQPGYHRISELKKRLEVEIKEML